MASWPAAPPARRGGPPPREARARLVHAGGVWLTGLLVLGPVATAPAQEHQTVGPAQSATVKVEGVARAEPLPVGGAIPDFWATGLDGQRVAWTSVAGRPAVVVVWASWCPHCQRLVPLIGRIAKEFTGVRVLTVTSSIGRRPGPTPWQFARTSQLTLPVAVDDSQNTLAHAFGVYRFPMAFWVRPNGVVATVTEGDLDAETLRDLFRTLATGG